MDSAGLTWPGSIPRLLWIRSRMSSLQVDRIQRGRIANSRQCDEFLCPSSGSLRQLLAALLLVCNDKHR